MSRIAVFTQLARYNAWANARLFEVCAQLGDAARRQEAGLFFRSVHGTLNHLLLVDRLWLGRLTGRPLVAPASLADELSADFDELWQQRQISDGDLLGYVEGLDEAALDGMLHYRSLASGAERTFPVVMVLTHLFNHQTHHRGQVTAAVSLHGVDYGALDLIGMPPEPLSAA